MLKPCTKYHKFKYIRVLHKKHVIPKKHNFRNDGCFVYFYLSDITLTFLFVYFFSTWIVIKWIKKRIYMDVFKLTIKHLSIILQQKFHRYNFYV